MSGDGADAPASAPPRFCTACGAALAPRHRFCGACGAEVEQADGGPRATPGPTTGGAPDEPDDAPSVGRLRPLSSLTLVTIGFAMAALLVGVVAVVLWTDDDGGPGQRAIAGAVTAIDEGYAGSVGSPCGVGSEEFRPTVTVVVGAAPDGPVVTAEASDGRISQLFECRFTYAVVGLPDADVYRLSVEGGEPRTLTRDELEAAGWQVDVSLGGLGT